MNTDHRRGGWLALLLIAANTAGAAGYRMQITFAGYANRTETLMNFPALVVFSNGMGGTSFDYGVYPFLRADGYDLRFWDASQTTELSYEIEQWNTNGPSFAWVRVPAIATHTDFIWAKWGDASHADQRPYTTNGAVWDDTFKGVWHLAEGSAAANAFDSTSNRNDGAQSGTPTPLSAGQAGGAREMSGAQKLTAAGVDLSNKAFTLSAWGRPATTSGDNMWGGGGIVGGDAGLHCGYRDNNLMMGIYADDIVGGTDYSGDANSWHYYAFVMSSAHIKGIYRDGARLTYFPQYFNNNDFYRSAGLAVGATFAGTASWKGSLDEVRAEAGIERSSNWIWACYMTMASNATFSSYGRPSSALGPPRIVNRAASDVTTASAHLNGYLIDTGGAPTEVWVFLGTAGRTGGEGGTNKERWLTPLFIGADQAPGVKSTNVRSLAPDTTYYYRSYASNGYGEAWADTTNVFITGAVTVESLAANAAEAGAVPGVFSIARPAGTTNEDLLVHYTLGGDATNGVDYRLLSGTALMAAGATHALVTVTPLDDHDLAPPVESVILTVSPGYNYAVGAPSSATVSIANNTAVRTGPFKMKISFSGYDRAETLTDFPVLVVFSNGMGGSDFDFRRTPFLTASGYDLRFWDAAEAVELPYQVEQWNAAGPSFVWARAPAITGTGASYIWAKWANPLCTDQPAYTTNGAVWANGYRGVWHMTEANVRDSTTHANTGTAHGTITTAPGQIGPAQNFDWSTQAYVDLGNNGSLDVTTALTVSTWLNHAPWRVGEDWQFAYSAGTAAGAFNYNYGIGSAQNSFRWTTHGWAMTPDLLGPVASGQVDQWHQLTFVFSYAAGHGYLYLDGVPVATNAANNPIGASQLFLIGAKVQAPIDTRWNWDGRIDELRVAAESRSADWIWAEYLTTASNATFSSYGPVGPEERAGACFLVR